MGKQLDLVHRGEGTPVYKPIHKVNPAKPPRQYENRELKPGDAVAFRHVGGSVRHFEFVRQVGPDAWFSFPRCGNYALSIPMGKFRLKSVQDWQVDPSALKQLRINRKKGGNNGPKSA